MIVDSTAHLNIAYRHGDRFKKYKYFRKDAKKGNQNIKWIFRIKV